MPKKAKLIVSMMLAFLLILSCLEPVFGATPVTKLEYKVKYAAEHLSTPMDWYNSGYFNNPDYKENRFVQYWTETTITPGGPRDTGFYMVYNEEGLHIFFQSNEAEREASGVLKNSSVEMFLQPGQGDNTYHQMIIQTNGSPIEYYEWQTENRNNLPFRGNVTVVNEEIPTGWGTAVTIPWETYYQNVPLNGEDWGFMMIRWAPSNFSPTWGGHVHQIGRFNVLDFQAPTAEQRTAMQKSIIGKAWQKFNTTAAQLNAEWLNGDSDDAYFFNHHIQPLIASGQANGSQIPNLDSLSAADIDALYAHVGGWFGLPYDADDARISYLNNKFFSNEPPGTVNPPSGLTAKGAPSAVALSWTASTSPDVAGYNIYADGSKINNEPVAGVTFRVDGLDFGTTYNFEVEAVSGSGEVSGKISATGTPSHDLIDLARWGIHNDGTDGLSTVNGLNQAIQWAHSQGITAVYLPAGTYLIPAANEVHILSNMLFEMAPDAIVKKEANGKESYRVFYVGYGDDQVTIKGGQVVGDRYTHDYSSGTHENGHGIFIESAKNTVIDSVYAYHFTGDAVVVGTQAVMGGTIHAVNFESGTLDANGQKTPDASKIRTNKTFPLTNARFQAERSFEFSNWRNAKFPIHVFFYDSGINFISSAEADIGDRVAIPDGAVQMRLTIDQSSADGVNGQYWNRTPATNTVIRNSELAFNRRQGVTVSGATNMLIENNIIHDMNGIAPMSGINVAAANGAWNEGVTVRGNTFYGNARNDVILYDGHGALIENNQFGSIGANGLAEGEAFAGGAIVQNNTFDQTNIKASKDIKFLNNTMSGGTANLSGNQVIVDGLNATDTRINVTNNVSDGVQLSNVDLNMTSSDRDINLNIWGDAGTRFKNVTISGSPSLRSIGGGGTGYHEFDNLRVVGYNPVHGINLVNGSYANSYFEAGEGGKACVLLKTGGKYVFDHATFAGNTSGGGGLCGESPNLDLTVTNSNFAMKGPGSAISIRQDKKVQIDGNVITATGASAGVPIVYIGYYWDRTKPAKVFDTTINNNQITADNAGIIGISTEYAGVGAEPFTITNNTLTHAIMKLKSNDISSGNIVNP